MKIKENLSGYEGSIFPSGIQHEVQLPGEAKKSTCIHFKGTRVLTKETQSKNFRRALLSTICTLGFGILFPSVRRYWQKSWSPSIEVSYLVPFRSVEQQKVEEFREERGRLFGKIDRWGIEGNQAAELVKTLLKDIHEDEGLIRAFLKGPHSREAWKQASSDFKKDPDFVFMALEGNLRLVDIIDFSPFKNDGSFFIALMKMTWDFRLLRWASKDLLDDFGFRRDLQQAYVDSFGKEHQEQVIFSNDVPLQIRGDFELVKALCIGNDSVLKYASDSIFSNKAMIMDLIDSGVSAEEVFRWMGDNLKNDLNFVRPYLKKNEALKTYLPDPIIRNFEDEREILAPLVDLWGENLSEAWKLLPSDSKKNPGFIFAALDLNIELVDVIDFAPFKNDGSFFINLIWRTWDFHLLGHASDGLLDDPKFRGKIREEMARRGSLWLEKKEFSNDVPFQIRGDFELIKTLCINNGICALEYASDSIREDKEKMRDLIDSGVGDEKVFKCMGDNLKNDRDFVEPYLVKNGELIRFLSDDFC